MRDFDGKTAVVTGAASGLGLAFAQRFARAGMRVVLADYEEEALERAVTELRRGEYEALGVVTDVSRAEALEELAQRTQAEYGPCHILCNNAGVAADSDLGGLVEGTPRVPVWEQSLNDWHWTFNVNFWGVVHGMRAFVPGMLAHGEPGHIVNTASIAGLVSGSGLPIYGATKHAVVRLSEALYGQLREAGSDIGVSVLCPGGVRTRIALAERNRPDELAGAGTPSREALEAREAEWAARTGEQGMDPADVADVVFRAVQDEQFWILTHDEYDDAIRSRLEDVLARRNPTPRAF